MNQNTQALLRAHQAIIDAWYANWLKQQQTRIDAVFARRRPNHPPEGE